MSEHPTEYKTMKELLETEEVHPNHKFHVVRAKDSGRAIIALTVFKEDSEVVEKNL